MSNMLKGRHPRDAIIYPNRSPIEIAMRKDGYIYKNGMLYYTPWQYMPRVDRTKYTRPWEATTYERDHSWHSNWNDPSTLAINWGYSGYKTEQEAWDALLEHQSSPACHRHRCDTTICLANTFEPIPVLTIAPLLHVLTLDLSIEADSPDDPLAEVVACGCAQKSGWSNLICHECRHLMTCGFPVDILEHNKPTIWENLRPPEPAQPTSR